VTLIAPFRALYERGDPTRRLHIVKASVAPPFRSLCLNDWRVSARYLSAEYDDAAPDRCAICWSMYRHEEYVARQRARFDKRRDAEDRRELREAHAQGLVEIDDGPVDWDRLSFDADEQEDA
jgi:hypothetical protein